ncbi:MAG TPA: hypothetical protein DCE56_34560 [Cyanobacteria bacterium UBA8553]|nr:hypothetical protein [Cyanobacteria bacterium UBA8553]
MSFVGVNSQVISPQELIQVLEKLETSAKPSYYFLRWSHRVSGFWQRRFEEFPSLAADTGDRINVKQIEAAFPSPEGQMFNNQLELRWKKKQANYEVLLLSATGSKEDYPDFQLVGNDWKVVNRNAHLYASGPTQTETRFPKKFDDQDIKVAQRYFMDSQTATVHFVALTLQQQK